VVAATVAGCLVLLMAFVVGLVEASPALIGGGERTLLDVSANLSNLNKALRVTLGATLAAVMIGSLLVLARPLTRPENTLAKILQLSDTLLLLRGVWCNCYLSWDAVRAALHSSPRPTYDRCM